MLWRESTTQHQKSLRVRLLERCLACEADSVGTVLNRVDSRLLLWKVARYRAPTAIGLASEAPLQWAEPSPTISLFTTGASQGCIGRSPTQKNMEQKPALAEDHSFGRELRVGIYGLLMAAGLITIFLVIMSYLATIVHQHFGGSLPFFLDKG